MAAPEQKYKTNLKGPADAPIKVVEFADFMCPGCRAASGALHEYFAQQGGDINLTFKNFPLEKTCNPGIGQSIHNGSCELALGAICASELGHVLGLSRPDLLEVVGSGDASGRDRQRRRGRA